MLLNPMWVNSGISRKYPETNEKWKHSLAESMRCKKAVLRGKFIAIPDFLKNKKSQISTLTYYPKDVEKEERRKLKVRRRKETIKDWREVVAVSLCDRDTSCWAGMSWAPAEAGQPSGSHGSTVVAVWRTVVAMQDLQAITLCQPRSIWSLE